MEMPVMLFFFIARATVDLLIATSSLDACNYVVTVLSDKWKVHDKQEVEH